MPPALASPSTPRPRLSDTNKSRSEVFVDIPPSPFSFTRMTPKNSIPRKTAKPTPATPKETASVATPNSLKRKLDVFVEIPQPTGHRRTPKAKHASCSSSSSSSVRRKSQVFVEIPVSPVAMTRMKGTPNRPMKASPLSSKAFNMNKSAESANKKAKLSDVAKPSKLRQEIGENDRNPDGFFNCHQCKRKTDASSGVQCTVLFKSRCRYTYCKACLANRYGLDIQAIKRRPAVQNGKHALGVSYQWTCPKCADKCNCNYCMKAKGLTPLGKISPPKQAVELKTPARAGTFDIHKAAKASRNNAVIGNHDSGPSKERAPRAKKFVREPKWSAVPTHLSRADVEDRFYLREFILRFSPLLKIGVTHIEELDLFDTFTRQCAKAVTQALLDLIAADAEPDEAKLIREALKKFSGSDANPAVLWARLQNLRAHLPNNFFVVPVPNPGPRPSYADDESDGEVDPPQRASSRIKTRRGAQKESDEEVLDLDNGITHPLQLMPCIIALCECALQGPSIRAEITEGAEDAKGENRSYFAEVRKENERWAEERASLGWGESKDGDENKDDAPKKGKAKEKDTEKDKAYRTALAAHKAKLADLENAHLLELQGAAPRFGPLGRDSQGRVYYFSSAFRRREKRAKVKVPDEEDRVELRKWGWFLAVWGRGGMSASAFAPEVNESEERWWGFSDPAEIRQFAKWLAATEGVDGKDSFAVKREDTYRLNFGGSGSGTKSDFEQGPPTQSQVKALVKGLNEYADLLEWRIGGGEAQS